MNNDKELTDLRSAMSLALNALDRDGESGRPVRKEIADELRTAFGNFIEASEGALAPVDAGTIASSRQFVESLREYARNSGRGGEYRALIRVIDRHVAAAVASVDASYKAAIELAGETIDARNDEIVRLRAATATVDAGTIDSPLYVYELGGSKFYDKDDADQHIAAAVAQKQDVIDLLNRQYCELETALANEHDEVIKLRTAAGVGEKHWGPWVTSKCGMYQTREPLAATAPVSAVPAAGDWITNVVQEIAEFDDRTSPDDAPDMMLVTADELREVITRHVPPSAGAPVSAAWQVAVPRELVERLIKRLGTEQICLLEYELREILATQPARQQEAAAGCGWDKCPHGADCLHATPADWQELPALAEAINFEDARSFLKSWGCLVYPIPQILNIAEEAMRQPHGDCEYKAVGEAQRMPGTGDGFTMGVFKGLDVPFGSILFIRNEVATKQGRKDGTMKTGEDILSALLWLYRRLPSAYGRQDHIEKPITELAKAIGTDVDEDFAERAAKTDGPKT